MRRMITTNRKPRMPDSPKKQKIVQPHKHPPPSLEGEKQEEERIRDIKSQTLSRGEVRSVCVAMGARFTPLFPRARSDDQRINTGQVDGDGSRPDSSPSSPPSRHSSIPIVRRVFSVTSTSQGRILLVSDQTAPMPKTGYHFICQRGRHPRRTTTQGFSPIPIPRSMCQMQKNVLEAANVQTKKCSNAQRVIVQARRRNFFSSPRKPCSQKSSQAPVS